MIFSNSKDPELKVVPVHQFLHIMNHYNYEVLDNINEYPLSLNIVGYRYGQGRPNYFDDVISVYWKEYTGKWEEVHFPATTLPGKPYLFKPINPKGTAILVPGQYKKAYSIGYHRGKYEALVQTGSVRVYRDDDLDDEHDTDDYSVESGFFGINIHRASIGAKLVGVDSAGCQVLRDRKDFDKLMLMCKSAVGWTKFNYTLVNL